jgi:catalase
VAGHLCAAKEDTRKRTYEMFSKVDARLGQRIATETEKLAPAPKSQAAGNALSRL